MRRPLPALAYLTRRERYDIGLSDILLWNLTMLDPEKSITTNAAGLAAARDRNRSMTDVDSMPAGPNLDALVARDVMGWTCCRSELGPMYRVVTAGDPPTEMVRSSAEWNPSSNLVHAFELVGERRLVLWKNRDDQWHAAVNGDGYFDDETVDIGSLDGPYGHAPTAALAICRAALLAVSK